MSKVWAGLNPLSSFERAQQIKELGRVACGTACLLRDGETILLLRRTGAHGDGTWAPPGGWVEAKEHPDSTVRREVWEEVGAELTSVHFIGYTFDRHPEGIEDVCLWFESREWKGHVKPTYPARVAEIRWCGADDLPHPLFMPFEHALEQGLVW